MVDTAPHLHQNIARRVRGLRMSHGLSLDALASRSGVSRSMISLIERSQTSPTAVVLEKIAAGFNVPLASLFDAPARPDGALAGPVSRRRQQQEWRDPSSGYLRRNVTPPGAPQPMQLVEVHFPPGRRVAFDPRGREVRIFQQVWVLEGTMEITTGQQRHRLHEGDCLAMELDAGAMFHNPTRRRSRYAVVIASENRPLRKR